MEAMGIQAVMDIRVPFSTQRQPWTGRLQLNGWDSALNRAYARALIAELEANADEFADVELQAVRLGGGHASHLGGEALWDVVRTVRARYNVAPDAPVTMRCALGDISGASMPYFKRAGVTRFDLEWDVVRTVRARYNVAPDAPVTMRCALGDISGASMPYFKRAGVTRFDLEVLSLSATSYAAVNPEGSLEFYPLICNSFLHAPANDSLGVVLLAGSPAVSDIEARRSFLEAPHYHTAHVVVERYEGPGADEARCTSQIEDGWAVLEAAGLHEYAPLRFARPGCEDTYMRAMAQGGQVIGVGLGARTRFGAVLEAAGLHEYAPLRFARPGCEDTYMRAMAQGGQVIGVGLGARTRFGGAETVTTSDLDTYLARSHDFTQITVEARAVE